jgi:hypothetical protein
MYSISFRIIELVVVWMQRFEICDFVCKKVCIKWRSKLLLSAVLFIEKRL